MTNSFSPPRICIVANELPHLFRNGGIGTHNWLLAEALAADGWIVHVLYCGEVQDVAQLTHCRRLWNAKGIALSHIEEFASLAGDGVGGGVTGWFDQRSIHVQRALQQLHEFHRLDLIEFAEWAGFGLRTIQARKMGIGFADARIICRVHSSSQWCRDGNRVWLENTEELIRDYFERYSFENADYQLSPSQYMLDYAKGIGWRVREDARVVRNCNPKSTPDVRRQQPSTPELVFFGRLESRKGLKLFLEVVRTLPNEIAITFLGKESIAEGVPAGKLIAKMMGDRPYTVHSDFDREQALEYLSESGAWPSCRH